jgi:integrase
MAGVKTAAIALLEAEGEGTVGLQAIRLLLLTGFRRSEALTLKWSYVDIEAHCARLPDTKTGAQTRPLGKAALKHLASFKPKKVKPDHFAFPDPGKKGHYIDVRKAWKRVAKRAEISRVTVHGLRHWFASAAAEMNYSELVIAGLLGHSAGTVTGRYATTPDSALISAADAISARLAASLCD